MTVTELRDKNLIVFEAIVGSRAYNLSDENSDTDIFGVYVLPNASVLGDSVDTTYDKAGMEIITQGKCIRTNDSAGKVQGTYLELRDYLRQLSQGVPQAIETLFLSDDCIMTMHDDFKKLIINQRSNFITSKLKYTFCYSPLRLLQEHVIWRSLPERDALDFFKIVPDSVSEVMSVKDYIRQHPTNTKAWALVEIPGIPNVYKAYVSYKNESAWLSNKQPEECYNGFMLDENDNPITTVYDVASPMQIKWGLSYRKNVYFDKNTYLKYQALKKAALKRGIDPSNKDKDFRFAYDGKALAHCYRIIKQGHQLIANKTLDLSFDQPIMFRETKRNLVPFSVLEFNFKGAKIGFEMAMEENKNQIQSEVSRSLLSEIELTLRSRVELTRAIEKNSILT